MEKEKYLSIGKITNFFGIKGEAKVGYTSESRIKNAASVMMLDNPKPIELQIKSVRFHKNIAIIKFDGIDDINDIIPFKGQRLFVLKEEALNKLEKNEFLISDLINCKVFDTENNELGVVVQVSSNGTQDLLNIKNKLGKIDLVPFVDEFFPTVDIKNKKITIKPIEGLLS